VRSREKTKLRLSEAYSHGLEEQQSGGVGGGGGRSWLLVLVRKEGKKPEQERAVDPNAKTGPSATPLAPPRQSPARTGTGQ